LSQDITSLGIASEIWGLPNSVAEDSNLLRC
jgi:hypothetical protein